MGLQEKWKAVPSLPNVFASNLGNVKISDRVVIGGCCVKGKMCAKSYRGKMLSPSKKGKYALVRVGKKNYHVHRLVALAWVNGAGKCVNHIDGNKRNNKSDNLEWCTYKQNTEHARRTGLIKSKPFTDGHKKAISDSKKKKVFDSHTGKIFLSMTDAAKSYGVSLTTLSMMLNGKATNTTTLRIADTKPDHQEAA